MPLACEHAQNADMGKAARGAAAKRKPDARQGRRFLLGGRLGGAVAIASARRIRFCSTIHSLRDDLSAPRRRTSAARRYGERRQVSLPRVPSLIRRPSCPSASQRHNCGGRRARGMTIVGSSHQVGRIGRITMFQFARTTWLLAVAALAAIPTNAVAQISNRPITIVVPYSAGTGPDILARTLGEELSQRWNQPVVVDNKPGASGNIGTQLAARATPDGHTLMMVSNPVHQQCLAVQEFALRPGEELRAGDLCRLGRAGAGAASVDPGEKHQGIHRLSESQARRGELRLARPRHAASSGDGIVQAHDQDRPQAYSLSRLGRRDPGSGRRPRHRRVPGDPCDPAGGAQQSGQPARGREQRAREGRARIAGARRAGT